MELTEARVRHFAPCGCYEQTVPDPLRLCFVCLGNVCRSPMAEAVMGRLVAEAGLRGHVEVESAGMGSWHTGESADPRAIQALHRRGYPSAHRARQFQRDDFGRFDLVLALDDENARDLRRLAPTADEGAKVKLLRSFDPVTDGDLSVPDPYYGSPRDFDRALDLIERSCTGLLDAVRAAVSAT
jgi:protein-tyrosine phosphatase